jgi:hypothetical protein
MSDELDPSPSRDHRVDEIIAAYLEAVDAGRTPDRQELLARHPDLAPDLEVFFADHDRVDQLAQPLRLPAPPASRGTAVPTENVIMADLLILVRLPCRRIVSAESSALLPSGIINTIVTRPIGLAFNGLFASIQPADEVFGTYSGLEGRRNAETPRKKREAELIAHLDGEFFCLPEDDLHDVEVQLLPRALRVFRKLSPPLNRL